MGGTSGMTCKTCRHPGRDDIDQALVSGEPHRSIAEQYGLSESSVFRHQENHVPATLIAASESRELAHGSRLLDRANTSLGILIDSMRVEYVPEGIDPASSCSIYGHRLPLLQRLTAPVDLISWLPNAQC